MSQLVVHRHGHDDAPEYEEARAYKLKSRARGWGRRPHHGDTLGATYLQKYEREVVEMFNSGVFSSTSKIGPAQMREELRRRYPGKFSIPSQQELRSKVSTLFMASKAIGGQPVPIPDETHVRKPRRGRKSTLPDAVSSFLLGAVKQTPTLKPQHGLEQVRAKFPDLPTLVTDKQIKAKVSAIKANLKKLSKRL